MIRYTSSSRSTYQSSIVVALALCLGLVACGQEEPAADVAAPAPAATETATATQDGKKAVATPQAGKLDGMSVTQLREAARKAYGENRLYAPAGNNAIEYYLALRAKAPNAAAASSALTDLLPMTVIATEQSVKRGDFAEAQRLATLVAKVEPEHPSLERLKSSIASKKQAAAEREEQLALSAEQEAQRQQELEQQRLQQQREQQRIAAEKLAAQRLAEQQAAEAAAQQQTTAAQLAAQQAAQRAEAEKLAAAQAAKEAAAAPTAADLRPLSTPAPQYPREAYRDRQEGQVRVEFTVGVDGSVTSARVVSAEPRRVFDRAALTAVKRWRFQPISAPVTTRKTISFSPGG